MPERAEPKLRPHPFHANLEMKTSDHSAKSRSNVLTTSRRRSQYAELQVTTNFTFLTGASHPEEYVEQAAALGHAYASITDCNTLAGIVRAHVAAKDAWIGLAIGSRLTLDWPGERSSFHASFQNTIAPSHLSIMVFATDVDSYGRLCQLLTLGKRRAPKGECHLSLHDLFDYHEGLLAVVVPPSDRYFTNDFIEIAEGLREVFGSDDRLSIAASCSYTSDDRYRLQRIHALAQHVGIPMVATNDVHYHDPARRALQDVLACIKHGCTIGEAGYRLLANAERCLKPPDEMARLFVNHPKAIARTIEIAKRAANFNLDELRYQYPDEICPDGTQPMQYLTTITWNGANDRYPDGVPAKVANQIRHELALIDELNYAPYFLTVYDFVNFARSQGILCQGRGAAANSAVCYSIGITSVDPDQIDILFERFISHERNEPPDIDIDFEHERREEVIQYIYRKYGRDRAALTAEVITYRGRSAIREVGKALGLSLDAVDVLAKSLDWWDHGIVDEERVRQLGMNPDDPVIRQLAELAGEIRGFPRHLSQHVGGFVITQKPLCELVPIENAAMEDRTVIEWDKDDLDAMGMLKVDVLGLGMLTCIRKAFEFISVARAHNNIDADGSPTCQPRKKKLRDDETERSRAGADARLLESENGEPDVEKNSDLSRLDAMATRNNACTNNPCRNENHAAGGMVRFDLADQARCRIDPIQHRRRVRPTVPLRSSSLPQAGVRITERTDRRSPTDAEQFEDRRSDTRNRLSSSGTYQPSQHTEGLNDDVSASLHSVSSSHSHFVSSPVPLALHTIPSDDPSVYDMICNADTIGVFQIESRAQMTMLPRLHPRCYYDLVIEVAIVRPGPIQGDMVHPYLRRRNGEEPIEYPSEEIRRVLGKTLGVPLFQEQAMSLAMVAGGFTPGEADQLRRAMASWKRKGDQLQTFGEKLIHGMVERGYEKEFAERCFNQLKGFSEYGFPESHAASFAHLVYVSAWLKKHYPAAFAAALLNSLPMGFYAPAQIVRDAQEHRVEVRPVDVNYSAWDCRLEEEKSSKDDNAESVKPLHQWSPAIRLGMRMIKGMRDECAHAIAQAAHRHGPFDTIEALWKASGVSVSVLKRLAKADAFQSMTLDRQQALWHIRALRDDEKESPLFVQSLDTDTSYEPIALPIIPEPRKISHDYASVGLSLKAHPISFLRDELDTMRVVRAAELRDETKWKHGMWITVVGVVLMRQRPATASGIVFMTLEDETGIANLIVRPSVYQKYRAAARHGVILLARGRVERQGQVVHVMTHRIEDVQHLQTKSQRGEPFRIRSRDFR